MEFKEITNINQFNNILATKKEISSKEEVVDGVTVVIISYQVEMQDTFNGDLAKECRGIVFRKDTGECICRPLHKFFNVGQKSFTDPKYINWDKIQYVGVKSDGSMGTPVLINDKVFWKSKKTFYSDIAIAMQKVYEGWSEEDKEELMIVLKNGYTPIYEYVAPDNQVVIFYDKPELVYLHDRNIKTGQYNSNAMFLKNPWIGMTKEEIINYVSDLKDVEGFVFYDNKHWYKLKTKWYLERHKCLVDLTPKTIANLYLDNSFDDVIGAMKQYGFDDRAQNLKFYYNELNKRFGVILDNIQTTLEQLKKEYQGVELRKEIAKQQFCGLLFTLLDDKDIFKATREFVAKEFRLKNKNQLLR